MAEGYTIQGSDNLQGGVNRPKYIALSDWMSARDCMIRILCSIAGYFVWDYQWSPWILSVSR